MEGESVKEIWKSLKKGVKKCETKREVKIRQKGLGEHSWWDIDYKKKQRNVYKPYTRLID